MNNDFLSYHQNSIMFIFPLSNHELKNNKNELLYQEIKGPNMYNWKCEGLNWTFRKSFELTTYFWCLFHITI
jgi:hypothetical protein